MKRNTAKTKFQPYDCQQIDLGPGVATVSVHPGPFVVRVHELNKANLPGGMQQHRYFLSVDCKLRELDALHLGELGWLGCTKSEATREANQLAAKLVAASAALKAAEEQALNWDTASNRHTIKLQAERLQKLTARFCCTVEPA